ncbi:hypothetical protein P3X46_019976, partial [Hevea brasiliensis]
GGKITLTPLMEEEHIIDVMPIVSQNNSKHFIQMIRKNPINFQSYNFIHKMATQFVIHFNFHKNHLRCFSINNNPSYTIQSIFNSFKP